MNSNHKNGESPIRVYFLGSGQIAVPTLLSLAADQDIKLVGVGTQPDRPAGRKRHLVPTPVGQCAVDRGWEVDKPLSVNDPSFLCRLRDLTPDVIVVIAFGQLLKSEVLNLPPFGCLNVHASLLPCHRGASPIVAAVLSGDAETGISFMQMDKGLDTGPVYCRVSTVLNGSETSEALEDHLGRLAGEHAGRVLRDICWRQMQPVPQGEEGASYAGKLHKADGVIDWRESADVIVRKVRAYIPWPRVSFRIASRKGPKRIQVMEAQVCDLPVEFRGVAGDVVQADKDGFVIACGCNALRIEQLIPEGKAQMRYDAFLRGSQIDVGHSLA